MAGKSVESRWTLKDLFTPKVQQAIGAVTQFTAQLATAEVAGKKFAQAQSSEAAAILQQRAAVKEGQQAIQGLKAAMVGAIPILGFGAVEAFGASIKSASQFQSQMAYVGTLLTGTTQQVNEQLAGYSQQLETIARSSGQSLSDLAGGLYQTLSAGVDAGHAMDVLTAATKAAVAGQTDSTTAIKTVTAALHAYGMSADQASTITDIMLKDVDAGNAEFSDLAQSMGLVLPSAASLHVSFADLNATIAALTDVGLNTSSAISGLNEAFMNILKPQQAAEVEAKKLGIQFNAQALSAMGLVPFLQQIQDKTHGNTTEMAQLFGSIQGLNAMLALTSNNGMKQLISAQKEMQDSAGTTEQQYTRMTNTLATQWNRLKEAFTTRVVQGADNSGLMSFLSNVLRVTTSTVNLVASHWKLIGPIIYGVASAFVAYRVAIKAAQLATVAFNAVSNVGFLGLAKLLATVVVVAIMEVATHWQLVKEYAIDAWNNVIKGTQAAVNGLITAANAIISAFDYAWQAIKYAGISIWDGILKAAQTGINGLLKLISPVSSILKHVGINIPSSVSFGGAIAQVSAPKWDSSSLIPKVDLSGSLYTPTQLSAQASQAQAQQLAEHTQALQDNTKALKANSQSNNDNTNATKSNTKASKDNTKALASKGNGNMSAVEIADTLYPRLERHLYGTS
ncbi:hypothetical protein AAC03nite_28070 [Alicyclobacillus acidoterrestris]|nr:hypothetical protein AAC03nite_28070 [Alicyclobacillus acidoterrestris]